MASRGGDLDELGALFAELSARGLWQETEVEDIEGDVAEIPATQVLFKAPHRLLVLEDRFELRRRGRLRLSFPKRLAYVFVRPASSWTTKAIWPLNHRLLNPNRFELTAKCMEGREHVLPQVAESATAIRVARFIERHAQFDPIERA